MINQENLKGIKIESETYIKKLGGSININLPILSQTKIQNIEIIKARSLIIFAITWISYQAPISKIKAWIEENDLMKYTSNYEKVILNKKNDELMSQELTNLSWQVQALWTFAWILKLHNKIDIKDEIEDSMISMFPNIQKNESKDKIWQINSIRNDNEIFQLADLYYRAHWYARDNKLNGKEDKNFNLDVIMERRKAFFWTIDAMANWDEVDDNT